MEAAVLLTTEVKAACSDLENDCSQAPPTQPLMGSLLLNLRADVQSPSYLTHSSTVVPVLLLDWSLLLSLLR